MTTVKVRRHTRDLIALGARAEHLTIDEYLTQLIEEHRWRERMEAARRCMADADEEYAAEALDWDSAAGDGLS